MKTPILTESELKVFQEPQFDTLHARSLRNTIVGECLIIFNSSQTYKSWGKDPSNVILERRSYTFQPKAWGTIARHPASSSSRTELKQPEILEIPDAPIYQLIATVNGLHRLSPSTTTSLVLKLARDTIAFHQHAINISHRSSFNKAGHLELVFLHRFL